jgi:HAE1 family hydrophobic/amphiphilic exporter-1
MQDQKQKSSEQLYLGNLDFEPQLKKSWMNYFVSNFRSVVLIMLLLSAAGLYAFFALPRESYPEVEIPIAVVVTTLPGASPEDVEELVTKKIETQIAGLKDLDKVTSNSYNSVSSITVEFSTKADMSESIRSLRDKVASAKVDLPADANESIVKEISLDDQPVLEVALTGPYDGFTMYKYAETLRDEMKKIPGIREVNISGGDEKEYQVAYHPDKLLAYGVSASQANAAIAAANITIPAGTFDAEKYQYSVKTDSRVYSAAAIAKIPASYTADGRVIAIGDLADVTVTAIKKSTLARLSTGGSKPSDAITLSAVKRTGASILEVVGQTKSTLETTVKTFNTGVNYEITQDGAEEVNKSFDQLEHDMLLTLLLVFGVLFLIVGPKEALIAGLSIPLIFFGTFFVLLNLGISLNFISLFSLILALGLLVDDAIVVVSATKQYLRTGRFTPEEAVLLVLRDFRVVLTTTTLVTIWAFLPLLTSTGIIGQFIKALPITVSVTLTTSFLVALTINAPLAAILERVRLTKKLFYLLEGLLILAIGMLVYAGDWICYVLAAGLLIIGILAARWYEGAGKAKLVANQELIIQERKDDQLIKNNVRRLEDHDNASFKSRIMHGILQLDKLLPLYERYLRQLLATKKKRVTAVVVTAVALIFAISLPITGVVRSEFFPVEDTDYIYIDITTPTGFTLAETDKTVQQVEQRMLKYGEIAKFTTVTGGVSAQSQNSAADNTAAISITLKPEKERKTESFYLMDIMRQDLSDVKGAKIEVSAASGGMPSGAAFQAQVSGDDLAVLGKIAADLQNQLIQIPGVVNPNISLKDTAPQYTFKLDPVKLAQNNLNSSYVGSVLRMALAGTEISNIIEGNKEVKIIATFASENIPDLTSIQNLQIVNTAGRPVFLKDLATIELNPGVSKIEHIDQKRTVVLTANVNTQTNSTLVLADFKKHIADYQFPQGYSISYGGENEQSQESQKSIMNAMAIAIMLIMITLVIQFNSFRKMLIVLAAIPMSLIGVFIGLGLTGVTLSFPGLIGVLALFGIVVKNAIMLVDKIDLNLKSGIGFLDSIVDAGKSRLEAIFITSICTIFGLLPITLSNPVWVSLGSVIIFGLALSSFMTLFMVPVFFFMGVSREEK